MASTYRDSPLDDFIARAMRPNEAAIWALTFLRRITKPMGSRRKSYEVETDLKFCGNDCTGDGPIYLEERERVLDYLVVYSLLR
jgi:hypothetical protein